MQNAFVGPIPADIDRLSRLRYLDLTGNNFSGDIPALIGRLRDLFYLFLVQNEFNGTWPTEIGCLANLEHLGMAYNDKFLPAPLPEEFGALKKLKFLWMTQTNLIGGIPETLINDLSSLERLDLAINNLNGPILGGLLMSKNLINLYLYLFLFLVFPFSLCCCFIISSLFIVFFLLDSITSLINILNINCVFHLL